MKALSLATVFLFCLITMSAQNDEASGSILLTPVLMITNTSIGTSYPNLSTSQCGSTTYELGTSTSPQTPATTSGGMNNDVWFHFVAVAEVAKIKVCNVGLFDIALELWNSAANGSAIASSNVNGTSQKEVICANSLVVGNTYKVRVGRSGSTGNGTFSIIYEHLAVQIRNNYFPDPPGSATCYDFETNFQRTYISYSVGSTRWKFVDSNGNVYGPYTGTYLFNFGMAPEICESLTTLEAYVEVQATDADCGNTWWGYSQGRTLNLCAQICPTISAASGTISCGGTICEIFNTSISSGNVGPGFQYQFRFVTDNGLTEFITPWSTSPIFSTSTNPYVNYFRYGKIYLVYVRVKRCNSNPTWCGPCILNSCGFPYANITPVNATSGLSNYCLWRNKTGPQMLTSAIPGMDQYRFRLMPVNLGVNPCASNPFNPTGGAITTGWASNFFFYPAAHPIPLNQVYILQAQCRVLPATFTNANGQTVTIPGQQSDWGWPCFVGFRSSASPAAGSTIQCCSFPTPAMGMLPEDFLGENKWTEFYSIDDEIPPVLESGNVTIMSITGNEITVNSSESLLTGNAICEVYNLNGQLIGSTNLAAIHESNSVIITTKEELPNGIYLITIYTAEGRVAEKFLIAR
jgi:hypothetical protein